MSEKRKDSSGRILKTGESQRPNGTYQYRYKTTHGETNYVYAPTLSALREKESEIEKCKSDNLDYSKGKLSVIELVERYVQEKQGVRYNTKVGYNFVLNILKKEDFCRRHINKIKPSDAKLWIIKLHDDGRSYSTITTIKGVLKPAFDVAVDDDILAKNPFSFNLSTVIEKDAKRRQPLSAKEQESFLSFIKNDDSFQKYYDEIIILLETGLRVSELFGLTKSDVDLAKGRISVNKQLTRKRDGEYYIESPKTKTGIRLIPLSDAAFLAFQHVLATRKKLSSERIINGYGGFLFIDRFGNPKVASHLEHVLQRATIKYNKTYGTNLAVTPHVLRHTFCTNMAQSRMPVKELQYLMGHADACTTMNIYTHSDFETAEMCFKKFAVAK